MIYFLRLFRQFRELEFECQNYKLELETALAELYLARETVSYINNLFEKTLGKL